MNKILKYILSKNEKGKLFIKINTLENENETLRNVVKDELYKTFMSKLGEPAEMKRLRDENKKMRRKIKLYKEMLLESNSKKRKK